MDINEMLALAGLPPKGQKLDENCAGGFAGTFEEGGEEARRKESRDKINKGNQDIDYDQDMTSESGCQSPYDDGHGQYGEKCLVGDDVIVDKSPEDNEQTVSIDLGEDDDLDIAEPTDAELDNDVHMDYEYAGEPESEEGSMMTSVNNVNDRYADNTVDPDMMIQKIDAMQQGGMSSASAQYDVEGLYQLPIERITSIYKRVMGDEVDESEMGSDIGSAVGGAAGTAMGGPVGGAVGSAVGGMAGDAITGEGIEDDMAMADPEAVSSDEWADDERAELDMVDVGDPELDMDVDFGDVDPTSEIPPSKTRDTMLDAESMIQAIMTAKEGGAYTPHSEETLSMLSADALQRILTKVGGGKVEEEDNDWRSEPGYQTQSSDVEGHLRGTSPYNGGEGFPTGSADNAVKHVGNTGGDFKDNPIRNADPVMQESDSEDCGTCNGSGRKRVSDGFGDTESIDCKGCDGTGKSGKGINESFEEFNTSLSEGFDEFCESYEAALEAELNEIGNMSFSNRSSMRSRGRGLSRFSGNIDKKKREMDKAAAGLEADAERAKAKGKETADEPEMNEDELNEIGNMSFSNRSSMRSRGYGRSRFSGNIDKKKREMDKAMAGLEQDAEQSRGKSVSREPEINEDEFEDWFEKEHGELPKSLRNQAGGTSADANSKGWEDGDDMPVFLRHQAESVEEEEVDPTIQRYLDALNTAQSGLDDPEIDHNYQDHDIEDLPRGDRSIDDMDAEGDLEVHMAPLGANADMTDILQVLRDLESKEQKGYVEDEEVDENHFANRRKMDAFDKEREGRQNERRARRDATSVQTPKSDYKKGDKPQGK